MCWAVISQVRPGRSAAWGRCLERRLAPATPLFIPPVHISRAFVCENLGQSPKREEEKEEEQVLSVCTNWDLKQRAFNWKTECFLIFHVL